MKLVRKASKERTTGVRLDPDAIARTIISMYHGFVLQMLWDSKTPQQDMMEVFDVVIDTLLPTGPVDAD